MNPLNKTFKIPRAQIRPLIPNMGGCFATDRITVDGALVGDLDRERPDNSLDRIPGTDQFEPEELSGEE